MIGVETSTSTFDIAILLAESVAVTLTVYTPAAVGVYTHEDFVLSAWITEKLDEPCGATSNLYFTGSLPFAAVAIIFAACPISTAGTLDFTVTLKDEGSLMILKFTEAEAPEYAPIPVSFATATPTLTLFEYETV